MIPLRLGVPEADIRGASRRRRGFGLDSPLPADRRIVLRAILRHLAAERPHVVAFGLAAAAEANKTGPEAGVPDLLLLAPGGRSLFVQVKTQAETLTRPHRAFADLCRACGVPLLVLRSLAEARTAFDRLSL